MKFLQKCCVLYQFMIYCKCIGDGKTSLKNENEWRGIYYENEF